MNMYVTGSLTGRLAVVLTMVGIALPYFLRRNRMTLALGIAPRQPIPYRLRLWPHFWIGYAVLFLSTLHAGMVMGAMARANALGIWAATIAFVLLIVEILLGLSLQSGAGSQPQLRRLHFRIMLSFLALILVHLAANG